MQLVRAKPIDRTLARSTTANLLLTILSRNKSLFLVSITRNTLALTSYLLISLLR
ncbi:hypothetical protein [Microcoleus sp. D3_18a_C4]|uniref:hypothetical protein n=1 Tax=unclassified Microcoleus TaxID=2642155 RepID=UPI002FD67837